MYNQAMNLLREDDGGKIFNGENVPMNQRPDSCNQKRVLLLSGCYDP